MLDKFKREFIRQLQEILSLYQNLLRILQQENTALRKCKTKEVSNLLEKKQLQIERIEEKRTSLFRFISNIEPQAVSKEKINLSLLAEKWNQPQLLTIRDELKTLIERIREIQNFNNNLVKQSLEVLNSCVNALRIEPVQYHFRGSIKENFDLGPTYLDGKI